MPRFVADLAPDAAALDRLAASDPHNPFATAAYARVRAAMGQEAWLLSLVDDAAALRAGCLAFVRRGRLTRTVEIVSAPGVVDAAAGAFWDGVVALCRRQKVTVLDVGTFGSPATRLPALPGERTRSARREHVLALRDGDLFARLSSHHKRQVKKARTRGLRFTCWRGAEGAARAATHAAAIGDSMRRRAARGEHVSDAVDDTLFRLCLEHGAAELHQALGPDDDTVLSSVLVLRSADGAYYQSAGTTSDGMSAGASQGLVHAIGLQLRDAGVSTFNLGGAADDNPGLLDYKTSFGTTAVELEAAEAFLAGPVWRLVGRVRERVAALAGRG